MYIAHIKGIFQLFIGNRTVQIIRQSGINIVIQFHLIVTVISRNERYQKEENPYQVVSADEIRQFSHVRKKGPVLKLHDLFFKKEYHRRKHSHTAQHPDNHAFDHNNAKVLPQSKGHKNQSRKTCNCCK